MLYQLIRTAHERNDASRAKDSAQNFISMDATIRALQVTDDRGKSIMLRNYNSKMNTKSMRYCPVVEIFNMFGLLLCACIVCVDYYLFILDIDLFKQKAGKTRG